MRNNYFAFIAILLLIGNTINAQLVTESFETEGSGTRYTVLNGGTDGVSNYFERFLHPHPSQSNNVTGFDGSYIFIGEDTEDVPGSTGPASVTLNTINVTGLSTSVNILLGVGRLDRFENNDFIKIEYQLDGGGYQTIGAFYGSGTASQPLTQDINLDGMSTPGEGPTLSTTLTDFNFIIPASGTNLDVRVSMQSISGGTEEIIFDNIRVFGTTADTDPPVVQSIVLQGTPAANATSITKTITFDENANNISTDDFELTTTGTAIGTIASVSANSGTTVDVTINTINGEGTLRLDHLGTSNITDDTGNGNGTNGNVAAFTTGSVHTVDAIAPTVMITSTESSPTTANPIPITVTFSEDVSGFAEADLAVTGGTISDFTPVSATEYTFNINHTSILSNSNIAVSIAMAVAQDTAGNDNEAAAEFTIVAVAPALHNEIVDGDLSNDANAPSALTFVPGTNRIIGSVASSVPVDARDYITFTIPAGMQLSQILLQNYDDPATANANDGNRGFHVLDEGPTTFQPGTGNPDDYLGGALLDPLPPGTDVLSILAGAPQAGAGFTAPLQAGTYTYELQQTSSLVSEYTLDFIVETETIQPTVEITSTESSPTGASPIPVTITFSESVSGFDMGDLVVGNGTPGNFSGSGDTYTVDISPTAAGTVTVDVAADVATDTSGNGNTAASQFSIMYDNLLSIGDELLADGLTIYPIPSNSIINITGETNLGLQRAEIFDVQGKLIVSQKLESNSVTNTLDISSIGSGLYLMTVYSDKGSTMKRIVKQ